MFLGFDLSTQQLKAVATDTNGNVLHQYHVSLDDFQSLEKKNPLISENKVVTENPFTWIKALDKLLENMKLNNFPFSKVKSLSGSAQQHGSVYWSSLGKKLLQNLNNNLPLSEQLTQAFTTLECPIWMDSSTTEYCRLIENEFGGEKALYQIIGSPMYERFTGPQIFKLSRESTEIFHSTETITLISNFLASLFCGDLVSVDLSDATGTGLLDVNTKQWHEPLLTFISPSLKSKLDPPVFGLTDLGFVSDYLCRRYGFSSHCHVIAFTGDNPASMAALSLTEQDVCISLGSSDTILVKHNSLPSSENVSSLPTAFVDSIDSQSFILMYCFKNGSLMRDQLCRELCNGSWQLFNELVNKRPSGNEGILGEFYDFIEITPRNRIGRKLWNANYGRSFEITDDEIHSQALLPRALFEGQALARRFYTEQLGTKLNESSRIILTGGASRNTELSQIFADVFNCPIFISNIANSAAYGAAQRAKLGLEGKDFGIPLDKCCQLVATPKNSDIFNQIRLSFKEFHCCFN